MKQGLKYWHRFVEEFPTVHHLANANEERVMKLWQGLGYYNRARNLHATAKFISKELNGQFPDTYNELLKLKGVGPYTAAAIGSIAFDIPVAAIDGNVNRVYSRFFGIETPIDSKEGKTMIASLAEEHLNRKDPGTFNQALMEFGALKCTPSNPDCKSCPLAQDCIALRNNQVSSLPLKQKKTKQRNRYFNFIIASDDEHVLMEKRASGDIWTNLYQFPLVETANKIKNAEHLEKQSEYKSRFGTVQVGEPSNTYKHVLSHQVIYARFWTVDGLPVTRTPDNARKIPLNDIDKLAVPRLIERYMEDCKLID